MKNKILVIEDDRAISELLCMNLTIAGYETVAAYDGIEAQRLLLWNEDADLAVVDIMLPGRDGFALMEDFRAKNLPVIYLTAKDDVASKVKGLKLGAEDYMVKPFEMLELLVRIEKILERTGRAKRILTIKNIQADLQSHQILKDGIPVNLKPLPLYYYSQNPAIVYRIHIQVFINICSAQIMHLFDTAIMEKRHSFHKFLQRILICNLIPLVHIITTFITVYFFFPPDQSTLSSVYFSGIMATFSH